MYWDIFCRVIDNYGDVGVCWRLSRQLAAEYGIQVRMLVDDLICLQRICPHIDTTLTTQNQQGVQILHWTEPFPDLVPAEVVIETFGCELPANYVTAMASAASPQDTGTEEKRERIWINLEYLSAEPWVEGYHGLASPHPYLPLTKYFFFPGFTAATGGLVREARLMAQRDTVRSNPTPLWYELGIPHPTAAETVVSLFCYDNAPIDNLLEAWAVSALPVWCLLPKDKGLIQAANWTGESDLAAGDSVQRGNLTLHILPFLPQENYDHLLWACDCNFVRGEDSFVRAQWAARPMIWHIYPQQNNAHQPKLEAFLDRYCQELTKEAAIALRAFHQCWNSSRCPDWNDFWKHRAVLQQHALAWAGQLAQTADLASNLVHFCKKQGLLSRLSGEVKV